MHLKESKKKHMGGFGGRKGKREVQENKNIDGIFNAYFPFYQLIISCVYQGL